MKDGTESGFPEVLYWERPDRAEEEDEHARQFGEGIGAGPYRTSRTGKQLPLWLVLLGKVMCKIGLHSPRWIPVPYHLKCRRCGHETYVGP